MIIDNKRALAYVVTVDEIKPIDGYDRVEYARTNGWWVIVSKNDGITVGSKCVYFEVDSRVNAEDERFAFLEKRSYKIKTQKMCKVISQGLLMPLSMFPEIGDADVNTDVTDILKVTYAVEEDNVRKKPSDPNSKYRSMGARHAKLFKTPVFRWLMRRSWGRELLFAFFGKKKDATDTSFPTHFPFIHKTDEERVENMPWVLQDKQPFTVTEKLDGTSCTYIMERKKRGKYEFYVTSRNVRQLTPDQAAYHDDNIYWELAMKYDIENKLRQYLDDWDYLDYVCIQGEGVGNVQGNPLKLKENDLYVFNFIDSAVGRHPSGVGKTVIEKMGMKWVPILDEKYILPDTMEEFKEYATAKSVVNPDVYREGVVLRSLDGQQSFKNVSREYLLKHNA